MTATATSKLPANDRPLIYDPDLTAAVERMLAPYTGAKLEKAQNAVRAVARSAIQGPFGKLVEAYQKAIRAAVGDKGDNDG